MNKKTAILIFTQTASLECKNKYFPNGKELFSTLNYEVVNKAKKTGLPFFIITEKEQIGNTFGERYTNAIEFVFKKGFFNIITVGNDTPELTSEQLKQAAANINESKTTIGPTLDGGFYLLTLNKYQFDKNIFLSLPWQKKSLRKELTKFLESKKAKISNLCFYNDLDNQEDIKYYLTSINKISQEVLSLLQSFKRTYLQIRNLFFTENTFFWTFFNKGSPLVS